MRRRLSSNRPASRVIYGAGGSAAERANRISGANSMNGGKAADARHRGVTAATGRSAWDGLSKPRSLSRPRKLPYRRHFAGCVRWSACAASRLPKWSSARSHGGCSEKGQLSEVLLVMWSRSGRARCWKPSSRTTPIDSSLHHRHPHCGRHDDAVASRARTGCTPIAGRRSRTLLWAGRRWQLPAAVVPGDGGWRRVGTGHAGGNR